MAENDHDVKDGPREDASPTGEAFLPPLEFSSLVILLYFPSLIQLGLMDDPASGKRQENLVLAKRNIDLLDLLKDKTKGNLDAEEEKFLEDALGQLKLAYVKKAERRKM
jgi:hypothetical protein